MMTCPTPQLLAACHDGELSAADRQAVLDHARQCPACAAELAELGRLSAVLGSAERASPSSDLPVLLGRAWDRRGERGVARLAGWLSAAAAILLVACVATWPEPGPRGAAHAGASDTWEAHAVNILPAPSLESEPLARVAIWMANDLEVDQP